MEQDGVEIVGEIADIETIATGRAIRRLKHLRKCYGGRRWRKLKGVATVRVVKVSTRLAEVHWHEAHGVGRKGLKIKRFLLLFPTLLMELSLVQQLFLERMQNL